MALRERGGLSLKSHTDVGSTYTTLLIFGRHAGVLPLNPSVDLERCARNDHGKVSHCNQNFTIKDQIFKLPTLFGRKFDRKLCVPPLKKEYADLSEYWQFLSVQRHKSDGP